ncbi:CysE Serine acetyltransferase [Methylophilaceae bacterium]
MKNACKMNQIWNFKLIPFLVADLRRARTLIHGESDSMSDFRLWLGVLSPRFLPVLLCRVAHFFYCIKLTSVAKFFSLLNFLFFGIEIAIQCRIGKGLFLPHTQGTVIGAYSIGENVTIFQGVTLGARELDFSYKELSRPSVGDAVTIGAGAKVLGGLNLGSGARVGANAVVLESIPENFLAAGVPARVIKPLS